MNPLLKIEQRDDKLVVVAKDYIQKGSMLGQTHIKVGFETYKTAIGEFLSDNKFPNCMLLEGELTTLWTQKNVFIGETLSVDYRLYQI